MRRQITGDLLLSEKRDQDTRACFSLTSRPLRVGRARVDGRNLICSWHLDRDIESAGDEQHSKDQSEIDAQGREIHPLYHLHFGGRVMTTMIDKDEADFGDLLLLEPPRLAHPPLDAILALDLLLTNFYPSDRKDLGNDDQYVRLVRTAQERYWRPYAHLCSSAWSTPVAAQWKPIQVWPHLV